MQYVFLVFEMFVSNRHALNVPASAHRKPELSSKQFVRMHLNTDKKVFFLFVFVVYAENVSSVTMTCGDCDVHG